MVRALAVAVLVLSGCLMTACGGSGGGSGTLTLDQYAARAAQVVCDLWIRCGTIPDRASCDTFVDLAQAKADIASGKTTFDGTVAAMCLDTFADWDCKLSTIFAPRDLSCQQVSKGTVADGGLCNLSSQCASGLCKTPLACDRDTTCCEGTCTPAAVPVGEGGACTGTTTVCERGLFCDATAAAPTCAKRVALGATCATTSACLESLFCKRAAGATAGTCAPYPKRGEPCADSILACDDSLDFCDPMTKTCLARLAVGTDCTAAPAGCVGYARCDGGTHKCRKKATAGEACVDETDCMGGQLDCVAGVCATPPPRPVCP
jgi:hypothetical protein